MSVHRILLSVLLSCGLILPSGMIFATGNESGGSKTTKKKISRSERKKLKQQKQQEKKQQEEQKLKEQQEKQENTSIVPAHSNDDLVAALEGLKQFEETEKQNDASTSKQPQGQKEADLSSGSNESFTSNSASSSDNSSSSPSTSEPSSPSTSHIVSSSDGSTIKNEPEVKPKSDVESPVESQEEDASQFKESPKPTPKSTPEPSRTAPIIDPLVQSGLIKTPDASDLPTVRVDLNVDTSSEKNSSSSHASGEDTDNESPLTQPVVPSPGQAGAESPKPEITSSSVQTEPSVSSTITVDQKELAPSDVHSQQNSQGEEEEDSAYHSMPEQPQDPSATLNEQNLEPSKQTSSDDDATISADEKKDQTLLTPSTNEQSQEVLQDEPTITNQAPDQAPQDVTQNTTPVPQQEHKVEDTTTPGVKQDAENNSVEGTPEDVLPGLPSDELKNTKRTFNARKEIITPELFQVSDHTKLGPVLKEIYGNNMPKHITYQQLVDKLKAHYAAFTAHDKLKAKVEQLDQLMNKDVQSDSLNKGVQSDSSRDIGMMSKEEQAHIKDIETLISDIYVVVVDLQKDGYLQGGWFATVMKSLRGHPVLTSVGCVSVAVLGYVGYNIATLPDEVVINSEPTDIQESQEAAPAA